MGWLSKIGNLIVNGNGAGEKLLAAGVAGIDKVFFTEEEKAELKREHFQRWHELQLKLAEKGTGTAVNRRLVSWFVIINVTLAFWVCTGFALAGMADQVSAVIALADKFWIGEAFVAVIGFYFGPHLLGDRK